MSLWNLFNLRSHENQADDIEEWAHGPNSSEHERWKQWLLGVGLALLPVIYGLVCIQRGSTHLFGRRGSGAELTGAEGVALAIAYIAIGVFLHFHYFWGLSDRLWKYSVTGKTVALTVFLGALFYALCKNFGGGFSGSI